MGEHVEYDNVLFEEVVDRLGHTDPPGVVGISVVGVGDGGQLSGWGRGWWGRRVLNDIVVQEKRGSACCHIVHMAREVLPGSDVMGCCLDGGL